MLAAGAGLIAAFGVHQSPRLRRGAARLVEPSLLKRRSYVAGLAVETGFYGAMGGMILSLNVMFQTGLGFSPLACSVATMAIAIAATPGSIISSILLPRLGRTTMHIGSAMMAIGLGATIAVLASTGSGFSAWYVTGPLVLAGFGMGMVFVPMTDVILRLRDGGSPRSQRRVASTDVAGGLVAAGRGQRSAAPWRDCAGRIASRGVLQS